MSLEDLPTEILTTISRLCADLQFLEEKFSRKVDYDRDEASARQAPFVLCENDGVSALSSASKSLRCICAPILFEKVIIVLQLSMLSEGRGEAEGRGEEEERGVQLFLRLLARSPHIAEYIRILRVTEYEDIYTQPRYSFISSEQVASILPILPQLRVSPEVNFLTKELVHAANEHQVLERVVIHSESALVLFSLDYPSGTMPPSLSKFYLDQLDLRNFREYNLASETDQPVWVDLLVFLKRAGGLPLRTVDIDLARFEQQRRFFFDDVQWLDLEHLFIHVPLDIVNPEITVEFQPLDWLLLAVDRFKGLSRIDFFVGLNNHQRLGKPTYAGSLETLAGHLPLLQRIVFGLSAGTREEDGEDGIEIRSYTIARIAGDHQTIHNPTYWDSCWQVSGIEVACRLGSKAAIHRVSELGKRVPSILTLEISNSRFPGDQEGDETSVRSLNWKSLADQLSTLTNLRTLRLDNVRTIPLEPEQHRIELEDDLRLLLQRCGEILKGRLPTLEIIHLTGDALNHCFARIAIRRRLHSEGKLAEACVQMVMAAKWWD